ncbi:restriction endonuclease [Phenylobacterium sp.]|uniref:restriction endonuclease n=1 Tax=Phenylobacterium sp. TaxID=1871053 RepID=UPI0025E73580|nr:restriction endonuclease [Phenylobacterium sp.]MBX3482409.1 restriction endonuclease [Phenylobacterium sp.]MCW5758203.1 restriction endonuclease [Phenylobacterium sp.]
MRYIKLGEGGAWLRECLQADQLLFQDLVPHEVAAGGDWDTARRLYGDDDRAQIGNDLREIRDFYKQPTDCLWITFGQGRLWWAFAEAEVTMRADGVRVRKTLKPWSCQDRAGRELLISDLSTSLTQTASYRRTICSVAAEAYLLRRLNAEADPLVERAEGLTADLTAVAGEMIAGLHWRDFEVLVDLIFSRSGWRRIAAVGGSGQPDSDLILQQAVTGERAFVQIKSKATAATLRDYLARFEAYPDMDRFFFACHSPAGRLEGPVDARVRLWLRPELAAQAMEAGLTGWLMDKRR